MKEQLFLVCLSFVAGFAGRRLLPMVSARLEGMVAKAVEQQVQQKTERLEAKIDNAVQYGQITSATNLALAHLANSQTPATTIEEDIKDLEALWHGPALRNRRLAIVLGNLYGSRKKYDTALSVLATFLEEKAKVGEQDDKDSADVLYNVACYRALKSASVPADQAGPLKDSALEALEKSVKLSSENAKLADTEPDLGPLRDDEQRRERFNQIISSKRSP